MPLPAGCAWHCWDPRLLAQRVHTVLLLPAPVPQAAWISAIVGAVCTVVAVTVQWFVIRQRVERDLKLEIEQVGAE